MRGRRLTVHDNSPATSTFLSCHVPWFWRAMRDDDPSCWRMACDPIVYTRTAIDFDPVSQCCPTGDCHAYAPVLTRTLCALSGTVSTCPDRMSFDRWCLYHRPSSCDRVRAAFLRRALAPYLRQVAFARRFRRSPFGPVAVGRFIT